MTESLQHRGMSPTTAISLAGLLFAMFLQTAIFSYYMGRHADREDVHDAKIKILEQQVAGVPTLLLRVEQAEKAAVDAKAETRLKEFDDQQRELREAQGGYLAIHGKGKR